MHRNVILFCVSAKKTHTIPLHFSTFIEYIANSAYLLWFAGATNSNFRDTSRRVGPRANECSSCGCCTRQGSHRRRPSVMWLEDNYCCPLFIMNLKTPLHPLVECPWAREIWVMVANHVSLPCLSPTSWAATICIMDYMWFCSQDTPHDNTMGCRQF